ncbi:ferritin [Candidatus Cardinium hertigii]|jgi:ferritin|uniref:Ferritin n=1 Tax=Candidatus Cardinium hertigii TaxID=247481 RepID=A0A3N2QD73_9BACT|nr:ferritin [Candidatus Cardinium hertigii]ROT47755.1 ferritin [Candidatus Cardinium hertigii]
MNDKKLKCILGEDVLVLLQAQIEVEYNASVQYLAMASWADAQKYMYAASFLYKQSEEERHHMLKIMHYVNNAGGHALAPKTTTGILDTFSSLKEVFLQALQNEMHTTKAIHTLVDYCLVHKSFATFGFLQWFVTEQIEEEATARRNLDLFDLIPQEGIGLYEIDKAIGFAANGKSV